MGAQEIPHGPPFRHKLFHKDPRRFVNHLIEEFHECIAIVLLVLKEVPETHQKGSVSSTLKLNAILWSMLIPEELSVNLLDISRWRASMGDLGKVYRGVEQFFAKPTWRAV